MSTRKVRHILSLSGGKDSTALAIYLRHRIPDLEYVFCDTDKELPETYEYLARLEAYLGQPIVRLKHDGRNFDHWLIVYGNYLPSARTRWCTKHLKIQPFERYVGGDPVRNYIGIRADEEREGYISRRPNITPVYPFKEIGITKADVMRLLDRSGLGLPEYYRWRSRSGCYFCFFQQRIEWVGLLENHPDMFDKAKDYEKLAIESGCRYTWTERESLEELSHPERVAQIKADHLRRVAVQQEEASGQSLIEIFADVLDGYGAERACLICEL